MYTRLPAGGTYYPICTFPTDSERLIGISYAFSAFVFGYPSSSPRAHCTPNKSVPTLRYTGRPGPVYTGHACRHLPSVVPWISEDRLLNTSTFDTETSLFKCRLVAWWRGHPENSHAAFRSTMTIISGQKMRRRKRSETKKNVFSPLIPSFLTPSQPWQLDQDKNARRETKWNENWKMYSVHRFTHRHFQSFHFRTDDAVRGYPWSHVSSLFDATHK